jgi:hypothetical protein
MNPEIVKTSLQGLPTPTGGSGFSNTFTGAKNWEFKKKFISDGGILDQTLSEKGEEKLEGSSSTMSKEDEHVIDEEYS